jgi:hypothetical protein
VLVAAKVSQGFSPGRCVINVVTTAINIPAIPKRLPRCDVAGEESPRKARMKKMPEIK